LLRLEAIALVNDQDSRGGALSILELAGPQRPEEGSKAEQAHAERDRNEER
jgi:hypothetical protein